MELLQASYALPTFYTHPHEGANKHHSSSEPPPERVRWADAARGAPQGLTLSLWPSFVPPLSQEMLGSSTLPSIVFKDVAFITLLIWPRDRALCASLTVPTSLSTFMTAEKAIPGGCVLTMKTLLLTNPSL